MLLRQHRSKLLGSFALLIAMCLTPLGSAVAVTYASQASPQTVSGYGSWGKGYGSWNATRTSTTTIRSYLASAYYRYKDADDHTVYSNLSTTVPGHGDTENHTSHDNVYDAWTAFRSRPSVNLYPTTSGTVSVKAGVKTCLDVPWRTDPCSSSITKSLSR